MFDSRWLVGWQAVFPDCPLSVFDVVEFHTPDVALLLVMLRRSRSPALFPCS